MFELMTAGPPIVAVIGPTLSTEMTVVGQIGPFYDVVQVGSCPMRNNPKCYPCSVRTATITLTNLHKYRRLRYKPELI